MLWVSTRSAPPLARYCGRGPRVRARAARHSDSVLTSATRYAKIGLVAALILSRMIARGSNAEDRSSPVIAARFLFEEERMKIPRDSVTVREKLTQYPLIRRVKDDKRALSQSCQVRRMLGSAFSFGWVQAVGWKPVARHGR